MKFFTILTLGCALLASDSFAMGSSRKTPAPAPAPAPAPPQSVFRGDVWLAPNVQSADLMSMFSEPHLWQASRQRVKGMQFYSQMLVGDCPNCEPNRFDNFMAHGAFARLKEWGIEISVETGAVKDWDCTGEQNIEGTRQVFEKMSSVDAHVRYIAMDEPFVSGLSYCNNPSTDEIADYTARYIQKSRENAGRYYPGKPVDIGLIEAYPHFSAAQISGFLRKLNDRGAKPSFFNLDFDHWLARNRKMSAAQLASDLKSLQQTCRELGIPFGMIYWGHDGNNPSKFRIDVLELAAKVRSAMGQPDRAIVQSWSQTSDGKNLNPPNLPETNSTSLTGLLLELLPKL